MPVACEIFRLDAKDESTLEALEKYRAMCDDEAFSPDERCSTSIPTPGGLYQPDYFYISIDTMNSKICSMLSVFRVPVNPNGDRWLYMVDSVTSRAVTDQNYKGNTLALFKKLEHDASLDGAVCLIITGWSYDGLKFYLRYGFKLVGTTGFLVYPLVSLPTVPELRHFEYDMFHLRPSTFFREPRRMDITKRQDNIGRLRSRYGKYPFSMLKDFMKEMNITDKPSEWIPDHSVIYSDFHDVEKLPQRSLDKLPSWVYRDSTSWPSFLS